MSTTRVRPRVALVIALTASVLACRSTPPRGEPHAPPSPSAAQPIHIVVLGSSTAAGSGLSDPATSWPNRYAAHLTATLPGSRLTNLAVGGYSTFHILPTGTTNPSGRPAVDPARNISAALALQPDAIIVNLPSNDAAMSVPVADSLANLGVVAAQARQARVPLWVTTSQPRALTPEQTNLLIEFRDRVRAEYGAYAIDFFTPLAAPDGTPLPALNLGDGIHPNAEGHRALFEQVRAAELPAAIATARRVAARPGPTIRRRSSAPLSRRLRWP